jgi:hypothetical protein
MWILKWLPDWIFYGILFLGVIGYAATYLLKFIPIPAIYMYKTPIQLVSIFFIVIGVFMAGAIHNEQVWLARVAELEKQYAEAQVKSEKVNTEIVTKYITTREIIKQRGEDQIRYIDREIVKYNEICRLPKEVITLHNDAAKAPK